MSHRSKLIVTAVLLVLLGGLGAADVYLSNDQLAANLPMPPGNELPSEMGEDSSLPDTVMPGEGVAKHQPSDIHDALAALGYTVQPADERSMLEQVVDGTTVQVNAMSILKDDDRIGAIVMIQDPQAKDYFLSLKDALLAAFSPQVQDLEDVTRVDGGPVRNELTVLDPTLSEERMYFLRSRETLVEGHAVLGKEQDMRTILDRIATL